MNKYIDNDDKIEKPIIVDKNGEPIQTTKEEPHRFGTFNIPKDYRVKGFDNIRE